VTLVHLNATAYSNCAKARVSMENDTPVAWVQTQAIPIPINPLTTPAITTAKGSGMSVWRRMLPQV
jgi:hypothetical protein